VSYTDCAAASFMRTSEVVLPSDLADNQSYMRAARRNSLTNHNNVTYFMVVTFQTLTVHLCANKNHTQITCALTKHHVMMAYWGSGCIAPLIL
jgi:hypothetical protein